MTSPSAAIETRTAVVDGVRVSFRAAGDDATPVLYLHGNPTNSDDWLPFLARTGGLAPDLPGYGRSDRPRDFDYSIPGYDRFIERFLDKVAVTRVRLVVHDWGGVGLAFGQRCPERLQRLVIMNTPVGLTDYRWHHWARIWRTRWLGEATRLGRSSRLVTRLVSRAATPRPGPLPEHWIDTAITQSDRAAHRAMLALYRSASEADLASYAPGLSRITAPTLVMWADQDRYLPAHHAEDLARHLTNVTVEHVPGAGHYPWLDRPEVVDRVTAFIEQ